MVVLYAHQDIFAQNELTHLYTLPAIPFPLTLSHPDAPSELSLVRASTTTHEGALSQTAKSSAIRHTHFSPKTASPFAPVPFYGDPLF